MLAGRRALVGATALVAYLAAWAVLLGAALSAGISTTDPRSALGPLLGGMLMVAPLVAGAASGLAGAAVAGTPWGRAALVGAVAGVPTFIGWAWAMFLGPFGLLAAIIVPPWLAMAIAPADAPPRRAWWPGAAAALVLVLVFAGLATAVIRAAQEGDRVATTVHFRVVGDAPYEPLDLTGAPEAHPDVPALSTLETAANGEPGEASFLYEEDARAFLALLGEEELARRSREAGIDPPRYVVRYAGVLIEYEVERYVVAPGGERRGEAQGVPAIGTG